MSSRSNSVRHSPEISTELLDRPPAMVDRADGLPDAMLVDEQRYTYLPLGDDNDPRVQLLHDLNVPPALMAAVWRVAMRVQGGVQNAALAVADATPPDARVDTEQVRAVVMGFAVGIGLAARNCQMSATGFGGLFKVAAETGNLVNDLSAMHRIAGANGHPTPDATIN